MDWLDVSNTTPRIAYTATGGQTVFVVPFVFADETHLAVYRNDDLLGLLTDYSVSGAGSETGGSVTLASGATGGDSIVILRLVPYVLNTHVPVSGALDVPAINLQFSLLVMMIQQLNVNMVRSLSQPASDAADFTPLPAAAARASKYLYFDANGQPTVVSSVASEVAASAFMLTLLDDPDAASARATLGITDQSAYTGLSNWHHCR